MTNGIEETEIVFPELKAENFLCKYDPKLVFWKHDKFLLSRDITTGIIFAQCCRCGALYRLEDGKLNLEKGKSD